MEIPRPPPRRSATKARLRASLGVTLLRYKIGWFPASDLSGRLAGRTHANTDKKTTGGRRLGRSEGLRYRGRLPCLEFLAIKKFLFPFPFREKEMCVFVLWNQTPAPTPGYAETGGVGV